MNSRRRGFSPERGLGESASLGYVRAHVTAQVRSVIMSQKRQALQQLVEQAREDPKFFHALVFDPESALGSADYLDRREKGMIISLAPEDVVAGLAGLYVNPGGTVAECGTTCGSGSCTVTCDSSCGDTCASSCDATCASASCGKTSSRLGDWDEIVTQPGFMRNPAIFRPTRRFGP